MAQQNMYGFPSLTDPIYICGNSEAATCPTEVRDDIYPKMSPQESCATSYADFLTDPKTKHFWVEDPEITAQGKADERARQFLYWVLTTNVTDNAPVISAVWRVTMMMGLIGVVLIAAIFGIGYIISQRTNYDFKIRIWPTVIKLGVMLLYVVFSSAIVLTLIQFADVIMKFSNDSLGGNELFNIYFANDSNLAGATEQSYKGFIGCRDLNIRVQEGVNSELFMLKLTNVTYYVMGVMLLLRRILLWFLLFVAPFLALLMPFIFIRNTGWIWIGVFFQWLFYGPLLSIFLGALALIWKSGIPFGFNFSRVNDITGYVYPTAINIVYGGPAQKSARAIGALNNGNYVDTFAEYIITLIMLWAVTFFPWWLLRIFRDYCCDGIYAMKNILLAMYDSTRTPPGKGPSPVSPTQPTLKLDVDMPKQTDIKQTLGSLEHIKKSLTIDLAKNMSLSATRITDIARSETNTKLNQTIHQNLNLLSNPVQASKPVERQQFMNLRSELFARAIKNDSMARTILASTSTSVSEKTRIRESIIKSMPQQISMKQIVGTETKVSTEQVQHITNTYTKSIAQNTQAVQRISQSTGASATTVQNILNTYNTSTSQPIATIVTTIAKETNSTSNTVKSVLKQAGAISSQSRILDSIMSTQKIDRSQVSKVLTSIRSSVRHEESTIESVTRVTQLPPAQVEQIMKQTVVTITENSQVLEQLAPAGASPMIVTNVLNSYISNAGMPATRIIEKVASETNTSKEVVSQILMNTTKVLENSTVREKVMERTKATTEEVQTVLEKAVAVGTTTTIREAPISIENVQTVINEFAQNETVIQNVSAQTQIPQTQVQNVVKSFANNISQSTQNIANTVSKETQVSEAHVQNIMQHVAQNISSSSSAQTQIAQSSNVTSNTVNQVATTIAEVAKTSITQNQNNVAPVLETIVNNTHISTSASGKQAPAGKTEIQTVINEFAQNETVIQNVSSQTHIPQSQVQNVVKSFANNISQSTQNIASAVSKETQVSVEHVQNIMQHVAQNISSSTSTQTQIAQNSHVSSSTVNQVATTISEVAKTSITQTQAPQINATPVSETIISQANSVSESESTQSNTTLSPVENIAQSTQISNEESQKIIQNLMTTALQNETFIENLSQQTQLKSQQIRNIITTYTNNITQPTETIIKTINESSGVPKASVQTVLTTLTDSIISSDQIIGEVAEEEGLQASQVSEVMQQQLEVASEPEKNIEKTISIPQSISLEDYEEVKEMWTKQYEEGEVPVTENIQTRSDWVEQEIVYITNTLNKVLSPDERLQQEGLDELGYLLPIFLINNLKGEELVVYLKAKLEAAKLIQKILSREEALKDKMKEENEEEEVFVDIKKEEEKPKEQQMSFDEDDEAASVAPSSIEDRENAIQEKLAAAQDTPQEEPTGDPKLDQIRSILQERADK